MTHFNCTVALPGHIEPDGIRIALEYALSPFNEELQLVESEPDEDGDTYWFNPDAKWDWWVVGGRWGGHWKLRETALVDDFVNDATEPSAFGFTEVSTEIDQVDCARVRAIASEGITAAYSFLDLEGNWNEMGHVCWFGMATNETSQEEWSETYLRWIASLAEDTWLVNCDLHI